MEKHIVIIEDNQDILNAMTLLLEMEGYKVTGLNALVTLDRLIALNADCFILDEQLPFVNGHVICLMLKSKPQTKAKPVVLMSAHPESEGYAKLCEAEGYLQKPFTHINHVLKVIEDALAA